MEKRIKVITHQLNKSS